MKRFVMGDIHGAHKALVQCLERSGFNKEEDQLIQLGDVADGWSEVYECIEELLSIKNLISIKGNHDDWFYTWLTYGEHPCRWLQGGEGTLKSYCKNTGALLDGSGHYGYKTSLCSAIIPKEHIDFFNKQAKWYKDEENNLFVHGGFNRHELLSDQSHEDIFWWDRDLWSQALTYKQIPNRLGHGKFKYKEELSEIFIGHTTTMSWNTDEPMNAANIWNLDTGAGFNGKLTIMNIDTKEYFQSDEVSEMYNGEKGRN